MTLHIILAQIDAAVTLLTILFLFAMLVAALAYYRRH